MRIVCISDTHLMHAQHKVVVPDGDILIHAGDLTFSGTYMEIQEAGDWLKSMPHKHKVVIAGNHDFLFEKEYHLAKTALDAGDKLIYLQDSFQEVAGIKFYGSPWTPRFYDWAFQLDRNSEEARRKWAAIPVETQILVTHGPPYGTLDRVKRRSYKVDPLKGEIWDAYYEKTGCEELAKRVKFLPNLQLHVFGHIHQGYGKTKAGSTRFGETIYVNASTCDATYLPINPPIVVDIDF